MWGSIETTKLFAVAWGRVPLEHPLEDLSNSGLLPCYLCDPVAYKAPELEKSVWCAWKLNKIKPPGSGLAGFMLSETPIVTLKIRGAITEGKAHTSIS